MLPQSPPSRPEPRTGLLLAAGIIAIVEAAPLLVIGLIAFVGGSRERGNGWGDLIATLGAVFAVIGAAWLVAGIGGVLRRQWGRVMLIIGNSLVLLLSLRTIATTSGNGFVPFVVSATGLGLAIAGQPRSSIASSFSPVLPSQASHVAPGWRADPYGRFQQRYWNGTAWTDQVSTGGRQQVDPMGASTVIPFVTPPTAFGPDDTTTS